MPLTTTTGTWYTNLNGWWHHSMCFSSKAFSFEFMINEQSICFILLLFIFVFTIRSEWNGIYLPSIHQAKYISSGSTDYWWIVMDCRQPPLPLIDHQREALSDLSRNRGRKFWKYFSLDWVPLGQGTLYKMCLFEGKSMANCLFLCGKREVLIWIGCKIGQFCFGLFVAIFCAKISLRFLKAPF